MSIFHRNFPFILSYLWWFRKKSDEKSLTTTYSVWFLLTTTIYCGNSLKFWLFTGSSSLCLKNLLKTNGYAEFDYITQEAEQCRVKCLPHHPLGCLRALPVEAKRKCRHAVPRLSKRSVDPVIGALWNSAAQTPTGYFTGVGNLLSYWGLPRSSGRWYWGERHNHQ